MSVDTLERLRTRIRSLDSLPAMPVVLRPLVQTLDRPVEQVDVERVVELVSYDKTIAAQCVRMANSALFARSKDVESVRSAVVNLGMWRIRDLVFSRCLTQVFAAKRWIVDATVFWRHSLGCAMVSRKFAELIRYPDAEKAYLAGLLHDIGILVNSIVAPDEFQLAFETAVREQIPLDEAEQSAMGFTHSDSGVILAEQWKMTGEIVEVIANHHNLGDPEKEFAAGPARPLERSLLPSPGAGLRLLRVPAGRVRSRARLAAISSQISPNCRHRCGTVHIRT